MEELAHRINYQLFRCPKRRFRPERRREILGIVGRAKSRKKTFQKTCTSDHFIFHSLNTGPQNWTGLKKNQKKNQKNLHPHNRGHKLDAPLPTEVNVLVRVINIWSTWVQFVFPQINPTKVHLCRLEPQENLNNFVNTQWVSSFEGPTDSCCCRRSYGTIPEKIDSSTPNLAVCPMSKYTTFHPALFDQMECRHKFSVFRVNTQLKKGGK